jgi:hypothetical protein
MFTYFFWKGMACILVEVHQMFYNEVGEGGGGGNNSLRNFDEFII